MKRFILGTMRVSQRRERGSKGIVLFTTWRDLISHWGTKRPMRCICTRKKLVLREKVLEDSSEEKRGKNERGSDAAPRRAIEGLARLGIRLRAARAGAASVCLRIGCVQRLTKSSEKPV